ncbi:EF-hand domain-containing protein [Cohaesibacter sp. CAU 1516]|uniref:EF-hand domain-containing protein n=1 Tax=Cohaesibacter sp. CAU 1516 TaxID=2576038 RepID=UPI0010FEBC80|nr:EF-hand domain-containing protein [Cohaesibacter sp. CAU 1516]TLP42301.1 EF-hand domain-containing protein [Cohaesibacter sp. CAU 1516]
MRNFLLFTTTSMLVALGINVAFANPAHHPDQAPQAMQGDLMPGNMMSGKMMGNNMAGGMMNPAMMIVMLDTDGDGSLSLEEFQSMHERMFAFMDKNKDGKLEASEFASHHASSIPLSNNKKN